MLRVTHMSHVIFTERFPLDKIRKLWKIYLLQYYVHSSISTIFSSIGTKFILQAIAAV